MAGEDDEPTYDELLDENLELQGSVGDLKRQIKGLEEKLRFQDDQARTVDELKMEKDKNLATIVSLEDRLEEKDRDMKRVRENEEKAIMERDSFDRLAKELESKLAIAKEDKERDVEKMRREMSGRSGARQYEHLSALQELENANKALMTELDMLRRQTDEREQAFIVIAQEKDDIETSKSNVAEKLAEKEFELLDLKVQNDELKDETNSIERELEKLREEYKREIEAERSEKDTYKHELQQQREKVGQLSANVATLQDSTTAGDYATRLAATQRELEKARGDVDKFEVENNELQGLAVFLSERLKEYDAAHERTKHADAGGGEGRARPAEVEREVLELQAKLEQKTKEFRDVEIYCQRLEEELKNEPDWDEIKSGQYGLREALHRQKRLKAHLREREHELEMLSTKLSVQMEANDVLWATSSRLKHELRTLAGLAADGHVVASPDGATKKKRARKARAASDADGDDAARDDEAEDADERAAAREHVAALSKVGFDVAAVLEIAAEEYEFDDLQLRGEMKVKEARLRGAMTVMEGQIDDLERERLHLLKQLRHTAMNISEQGVKFVGLDAEQLRLVQDFVIDLKAGGDGRGRLGDDDDAPGGRAFGAGGRARAEDAAQIVMLNEEVHRLTKRLEEELKNEPDWDDVKQGTYGLREALQRQKRL